MASSKPGYPCVISLKDANVGEDVWLLPYEHISSNSPFQSKGPIYIRAGVKQATYRNSIPDNLKTRMLSVRAYDEQDMMVDAHTLEGSALEAFIQEVFQDADTKYIQVHISGPGCFNCQIERL